MKHGSERHRTTDTVLDSLKQAEWPHLTWQVAPAGVWEWHIQANDNVWSDTLFRLLGYGPGSCQPGYHNWLQAIHPDDRILVSQRFLDILNTQTNFTVEYRVQWPDGTIRWLMAFGQVTANQAGQPAYLLSLHLDVTARECITSLSQVLPPPPSSWNIAPAENPPPSPPNHSLLRPAEQNWGKDEAANQAMQAMREHEAQLFSIFQTIPDGIAIINGDGQIMVANPAAERILQLTCSDITERVYNDPSWSITTVDGQPFPEEELPFAQVMRTGQPIYGVEHAIAHTDGTRVMLSINASPWLDTAGNITGVIAAFSDITDRKQTELAIQQLNAALEAQNHDLEALVEQRTAELLTFINALPDAIFVLERSEMRISFCNEQFASLTSFRNCQDVQGKTLFECFSLENMDAWAETNNRVFERGEILHTEESLILPSRTLYLDTYKIPLKHDDGTVYALIGTSRNITELVQTRQALIERTHQLEAINHELDSFSSSVSHDLRAPLRHISGFIHALRQQLSGPGKVTHSKVEHYLQIIENSSYKMGLLIDGLLALSRIGRRDLNLWSVNLHQLVNAAIELIGSETKPENSPAIEWQIGTLPIVQGDAALLQQVFTNLIGNAVKFSRDRQPARIEIDCLPDQTIFVRDNGVGFQMEYRDKLFGAFQRLHSQQDFEGTGIGLAIVQRIIHRHGGIIWADSQPGQGATFYFRLGTLDSGATEANSGSIGGDSGCG